MDLKKLEAKEIIRLMCLGHPCEHGEDCSRSEIMKECSRRGENLLKDAGWNCDLESIYKNRHTGCEETLKEQLMRYSHLPEGEKNEVNWDRVWGVVEHWMPKDIWTDEGLMKDYKNLSSYAGEFVSTPDKVELNTKNDKSDNFGKQNVFETEYREERNTKNDKGVKSGKQITLGGNPVKKALSEKQKQRDEEVRQHNERCAEKKMLEERDIKDKEFEANYKYGSTSVFLHEKKYYFYGDITHCGRDSIKYNARKIMGEMVKNKKKYGHMNYNDLPTFENPKPRSVTRFGNGKKLSAWEVFEEERKTYYDLYVFEEGEIKIAELFGDEEQKQIYFEDDEEEEDEDNTQDYTAKEQLENDLEMI